MVTAYKGLLYSKIFQREDDFATEEINDRLELA